MTCKYSHGMLRNFMTALIRPIREAGNEAWEIQNAKAS